MCSSDLPGRPPIRVYALPQTLAVLRAHLFNDQLWPDFTRLPEPQAPVLTLHELAVGQTLTLGAHARQVRVLPARHIVPGVGFAVLGRDAQEGDWAYSGDTGPNPALWEHLQALHVRELVIEAAFSEAEAALAARSGHHCPSSLAAELAHLPAGVQLRLTHIKPGEMPTVLSELQTRLPAGCTVSPLQAGQRFIAGRLA